MSSRKKSQQTEDGPVTMAYDEKEIKKLRAIGAALGVSIEVIAKTDEGYANESEILRLDKGKVLLHIYKGENKDLKNFWDRVTS